MYSFPITWYMCRKCSATFSSKEKLISHKKQVHKSEDSPRSVSTKAVDIDPLSDDVYQRNTSSGNIITDPGCRNNQSNNITVDEINDETPVSDTEIEVVEQGCRNGAESNYVSGSESSNQPELKLERLNSTTLEKFSPVTNRRLDIPPAVPGSSFYIRKLESGVQINENSSSGIPIPITSSSKSSNIVNHSISTLELERVPALPKPGVVFTAEPRRISEAEFALILTRNPDKPFAKIPRVISTQDSSVSSTSAINPMGANRENDKRSCTNSRSDISVDDNPGEISVRDFREIGNEDGQEVSSELETGSVNEARTSELSRNGNMEKLPSRSSPRGKSSKVRTTPSPGVRSSPRTTSTSNKYSRRAKSGRKRHMCNDCDKCFSQLYLWTEHIKVHMEKKLNLCKHCGKTYSTKDALQYHMELHKKKKLYSCKHCSKKFFDKDNFENHKETHPEVHKCQFCGIEFPKSGSLAVHLTRSHGEDKSYSCVYCGRDCESNTNLKKHMCVHTGEKSYTCYYCCKSFAKSLTLKSHVAAQHENKSYECFRCGKGLQNNKNLKYHVQVMHNVTESSVKKVTKQKLAAGRKKQSPKSQSSEVKRKSPPKNVADAEKSENPTSDGVRVKIENTEEQTKSPSQSISNTNGIMTKTSLIKVKLEEKTPREENAPNPPTITDSDESEEKNVGEAPGKKKWSMKIKLKSPGGNKLKKKSSGKTGSAVAARKKSGEVKEKKSRDLKRKKAGEVREKKSGDLKNKKSSESKNKKPTELKTKTSSVKAEKAVVAKKSSGEVKEKKFHTCPICDKSFSRNFDMKKHILKFLGKCSNKPYSCNYCGKRFAIQKTLVTHMATHTA